MFSEIIDKAWFSGFFRLNFLMLNFDRYYSKRINFSQMFYKTGALKNFAVFTRKHLCWSLFLKSDTHLSRKFVLFSSIMKGLLKSVLLNRAPTSTQLRPPPPSSFQHPPSSTHFHPAHFSLRPVLCNTLSNIWTKMFHVIGQFPQI